MRTLSNFLRDEFLGINTVIKNHGIEIPIGYNAIEYNRIQYNTIQYNTIQYNTIQYNTIQILLTLPSGVNGLKL